ncbi:hypothetical protein IQ06DRAFT_105032 [Phaeosphaeriaceae sp. SRC1lsM3a]|nr:hypothetical protein IQ06DRAFT_105032 [Stagonospora sp. SRC1lsM3a]
MSLSSLLNDAASYCTGGARSFPALSDESVWRTYACNAPDQVCAKFFFCYVDGHGSIQPAAAAKPAAGYVVPVDEDLPPVIVGHYALAVIWLLREMFPSVSEATWQELARGVGSTALK